ncbi:MAG: hypothetical protein K8R63_07440 [Bacteroidales bacterium]|nr:hypothetical protein [Bacteroidales bacterium]
MDKRFKDIEEYKWMKEYLAKNRWVLLEQYGAHSVGIGWKKVAGQKTKQLAIIFYVEKKDVISELGKQSIPEKIEFKLSSTGKIVSLLTDVIESEAAVFE